MLETLKNYLRITNAPIILAMLSLITCGILAISVAEGGDGLSDSAMTQLRWCIPAMAAFVVFSAIPIRFFNRTAYILFALTLFVLVLVFVLPPVRGSHRWIDLKILKIQPSEIAKLTFVIMLARYLSFGDNYRRLRGLIAPFLLTLIPMGLVLKEPDLGTSLLFLPTLYFMLFMAGAKVRHLLGIVIVGTAIMFIPVSIKVVPQYEEKDTVQVKDESGEMKSVVVTKTLGMSPQEISDRKSLAYWTYVGQDGVERIVAAAPIALLAQHQVNRITGWLNQDDPETIRGSGYQQHMSKVVMGSGCLTGRESMSDAVNYYNMLPDDHTDFIFSVVGGKWGFLGCLVVLLLYCAILFLGLEISVMVNDAFGRLLVVGLLGLMLTQLSINICVASGVFPVTGMTLPFISYGGSSLVINCAAIGLIVNVGRGKHLILFKKPFEHIDGEDDSGAKNILSGPPIKTDI